MTAHPTIGIISPGDMGHALGAVPVRETDILLSVLVPAQAHAFAERIAAAMRAIGSTPLFADCNAISPRTARAIERLLNEAGAEVVDVGIIGAPPRVGRAETRLYASGPGAARLSVLGEYGLDVRVIGLQVGQASGLKMCYASLTKGLTALATQALVAGEVLSETLIGELRESQAELLGWFERQVPRMPPKAYRWVGEMEEIARTYADLGLPPQMLGERQPSIGWWSRRSWVRRRRRSDTAGRPWPLSRASLPTL